MKVIGGSEQIVGIKGTGLGVDHATTSNFLNNKTRIEEKSSLCSLSLDRIQLGNIPLGSPVSRVPKNTATFYYRFSKIP